MFNSQALLISSIAVVMSFAASAQDTDPSNPAEAVCQLDNNGELKGQLRRQSECLALYKKNQLERAELVKKELEILTAQRKKLEQENKILEEKERQRELDASLAAPLPKAEPEAPVDISAADTRKSQETPWEQLDNVSGGIEEIAPKVDLSSLPQIWALREAADGVWTALLKMPDGSIVKVSAGDELKDGYSVASIGRQGVSLKIAQTGDLISLGMGN